MKGQPQEVGWGVLSLPSPGKLVQEVMASSREKSSPRTSLFSVSRPFWPEMRAKPWAGDPASLTFGMGLQEPLAEEDILLLGWKFPG